MWRTVHGAARSAEAHDKQAPFAYRTRARRARLRPRALLPRPHLIAALLGWLLAAGDVSRALADASQAQFWAVHAQTTYIEQESSDFRAPYSGPNSLTPDAGRETIDATLYLGARPWAGAEAWINPEIEQGFGLSDTHGVAGFPSAEAYKIGSTTPYLRLQRLFLRQTFDGGGEREQVAANANQLAGMRSADRWVLTIGKFAITDIFDLNQYAHDPRSDFLNWTATDAGSFDYAADPWGYTVGAAAERYHGAWSARVGVFDLSDRPNSKDLSPGLSEFQVDLELERRHELLGRPGKLLLTLYDSRGRMGLLDAALQLARETNTVPDAALVRGWRSRRGAQLGLEQQISDDLGLFARIGKASGNVEVYEFTDVDRALSAGLSLQGARWGRPADTVGVAAIDNAISGEREAYLNAGGLGLLIGDGRLPHPGPELIGEAYYSVAAWRALRLSLDYQFVEHPGYNRDRGPVSVYALRVHLQF
jgi:high affinity Mn2+ porin